MNTAVADEVIDSDPCRIRGAANTPRAWEIRPTSEELEVIVESSTARSVTTSTALLDQLTRATRPGRVSAAESGTGRPTRPECRTFREGWPVVDLPGPR